MAGSAVDIPLGWETAVDPEFRCRYYFHRETGARTWHKPAHEKDIISASYGNSSLINDIVWEEFHTEAGKLFYFHRGRNEVSWKLPLGARAVPPRASSSTASAVSSPPRAPLKAEISPPRTASTVAGGTASRQGSPAAKRQKVAESVTASSGAATAGVRAVAVAPTEGNSLLADIFEEMAAVQKLKRDRFRSIAYTKAALALRNHPDVILSGAQAKAIDGIGAGMARRIDIVLETGELEELKELKRDSDVIALRELRAVHGIGAVRAGELVEKGIRSLDDLRTAVANGNVHLDGTQTVGLKYVDDCMKKIPREEMMEHERFLHSVGSRRHALLHIVICGSYRRGKLESGDIDVLITASDYTTSNKSSNAKGTLLKAYVQSLKDVGYICDDLAAGDKKYMGICCLPRGAALHRRLDIRCIPNDQFAFGTLYFTGSAGLSVRLRMRAIELGFKLSEYCLENESTGEKIVCSTEREIFEALKLDYLEPSDR